MKRSGLLFLILLGCGGDDDGTPMDVDGGAPETDGGRAAADAGPAEVDAGSDAGPQGCSEGCVIEELALGRNSACARRENGEVLCWGGNFFGQLGDNRRHGDCRSGGVEIIDCSDKPVVAQDVVASSLSNEGGWSTCATSAEGVFCWGLGTIPPPGSDQRVRRRVPEPEERFSAPEEISNASGLLCARSGGSVDCLGFNDSGQLGNGDFEESVPPVRVQSIDSATAIYTSTSGSFACAIVSDASSVRCWGSDSSGQLGDGNVELESCGSDVDARRCTSAPVDVVDLTGVEALALGRQHACALAGGAVSCWGNAGAGQLGLGERGQDDTPQAVPGLTDITQIAAGSDHTCALGETGDVFCWGRNEKGQVGDGEAIGSHESCDAGGSTVDCVLSPVQVVLPVPARFINAGGQFSCAIGTDDNVYCWGENNDRQLGQSDREDRSTPIVIQGLD